MNRPSEELKKACRYNILEAEERKLWAQFDKSEKAKTLLKIMQIGHERLILLGLIEN